MNAKKRNIFRYIKHYTVVVYVLIVIKDLSHDIFIYALRVLSYHLIFFCNCFTMLKTLKEITINKNAYLLITLTLFIYDSLTG